MLSLSLPSTYLIGLLGGWLIQVICSKQCLAQQAFVVVDIIISTDFLTKPQCPRIYHTHLTEHTAEAQRG